MGPSEWRNSAFPTGSGLLSHLHDHLLQSDALAQPIVLHLFSAAFQPQLGAMYAWVWSTKPLDPRFGRPMEEDLAHLPWSGPKDRRSATGGCRPCAGG